MIFTSDPEKIRRAGVRSWSRNSFASRVGQSFKSYAGTNAHRTGMRWMKESYGLAGADKFGKPLGALGRGAGFAYLGHQAYSGYREGGAFGAVKNIAWGAAEQYALGVAVETLGITASGAAIGVAAAAGIGLGLFGLAAASQGIGMTQLASRPYVHDYMRKRAKLEMGSPIQDPYGMVSSIRKRSLMAMRQSKITARGALGMESNRRYIPYMR